MLQGIIVTAIALCLLYAQISVLLSTGACYSKECTTINIINGPLLHVREIHSALVQHVVVRLIKTVKFFSMRWAAEMCRCFILLGMTSSCFQTSSLLSIMFMKPNDIAFFGNISFSGFKLCFRLLVLDCSLNLSVFSLSEVHLVVKKSITYWTLICPY